MASISFSRVSFMGRSRKNQFRCAMHHNRSAAPVARGDPWIAIYPEHENARRTYKDVRRAGFPPQESSGGPGGNEKRSEEHTSELQSLMRTSSAAFRLTHNTHTTHDNK